MIREIGMFATRVTTRVFVSVSAQVKVCGSVRLVT
jgi:hypothetical protein